MWVILVSKTEVEVKKKKKKALNVIKILHIVCTLANPIVNPIAHIIANP